MGKLKDNLLAVILLVMGLMCFVLYFVFQDNSHKVTFNSNGGSSVESQSVKDNELVIKPENPTKENAEFVNWYLGDNVYEFNRAVTSDITLTAVWKNVYDVVVTLDELSYSTKVLDGEKLDITSLNFTNREGYTIKLYIDDENEYNLEDVVASNLNLKGNYVALMKYVVKFDSSGASKVEDMEVWENSLIKEPAITKDGYLLDGWYQDDKKYDFNTPVSSNLNLKAKWIEKGKINVNFSVDGKIVQTVAVKENTKVSPISNPIKQGAIFTEWQLNGSKYDFNSLVTKEITLVANFRDAKEVTVTFNYDNGSANKIIKVYEGEKITKPATPIKTGYKFVAWEVNGTSYNFNNPVTSNITLKAKWAIDVYYKVTFNSVGGSDVKTQNVEAGARATRPTNPVKSGHVFLEWQLNGKPYDFNTVVNSDITLYATWRELGQFLVSFTTDGGTSVNSQLINEGDNVIKPADPTKNGFTFVEWQLDGKTYNFNTPVVKSINLVAIWEENS